MLNCGTTYWQLNLDILVILQIFWQIQENKLIEELTMTVLTEWTNLKNSR